MLMRFALNRGLMLSEELLKEADLNNAGVVENQLDILSRSIDVALHVHESDLSYQRRVSTGNNIVNINYASFGVTLGQSYIAAARNIFDASAQYRVMYKAYEMMNWDLSQDRNAKDYSEVIVDIYRTLERLSDIPSRNDIENIKNTRVLNYLGEKINKNLMVDLLGIPYLLAVSAEQLFYLAKNKMVGSCRITQGKSDSAYNYYIKGYTGKEREKYFDVSNSKFEIISNLRYYIKNGQCGL